MRHIQDELVSLALLKSEEYPSCPINDPLFAPDEQPQTIVKVENSEVGVAPYITRSEQAIIEAKLLEKERRRLEMLADDFRERALMTMMDGVLEHKWEDEIKKDPLKPECLLTEKDPKDYNETDLREVWDYEQKVAQVEADREKYREILESEKQKLKKSLDEQIVRFNMKVGVLLKQKMEVESAVCQEEMRILRNTLYNHHRLAYDRMEGQLRDEIIRVKEHIDYLMDILNEIQEKVVDYRNGYESLNSKDKMLDKQFKTNFSETSAIVDQAYKIFK